MLQLKEILIVIMDITYSENDCVINRDVTILDTARIDIGKNVFIALGVDITVATHPLDVKLWVERNFIGSAIKIKDNVWIGANAAILQGVTIGKIS